MMSLLDPWVCGSKNATILENPNLLRMHRAQCYNAVARLIFLIMLPHFQ
jgi:hypothetical protein